jgi:hypothetical protein
MNYKVTVAAAVSYLLYASSFSHLQPMNHLLIDSCKKDTIKYVLIESRTLDDECMDTTDVLNSTDYQVITQDMNGFEGLKGSFVYVSGDQFQQFELTKRNKRREIIKGIVAEDTLYIKAQSKTLIYRDSCYLFIAPSISILYVYRNIKNSRKAEVSDQIIEKALRRSFAFYNKSFRFCK